MYSVGVVFLLMACDQGHADGPTWDIINGEGPSSDIPHFQSNPPEELKGIKGDPGILPGDSIEIQAMKLAVANTYGDAKEFYEYQDKWGRGGALKQDIEYLQFLLTHPETAAIFKGGLLGSALAEYAYLKKQQDKLANLEQDINLVIPGIKIVHATGNHICWSSQAIGYQCHVDNRLYTDCAEAVQKLKETNCCKFAHPDGSSSQFIPGSCF